MSLALCRLCRAPDGSPELTSRLLLALSRSLETTSMVFIQQFLNGLQLGSLYALIALGYSLVYGVLLLITFAHGDVFMLGAFIGVFGAFTLGLPFVPTLLVSMLLTGSIAVLIERVASKPLRHASRLSAVITALGVGLMLENGLLALTGAIPPSIPRGLIETNSYLLDTIQVRTNAIPVDVLT